MVPTGGNADEREAPVLAVIDGRSAAGATQARSIVDGSQRDQAANVEAAPGAGSPPIGPVVPVVAGQSAKPAVAADAFTSGFNFGVLLCVLVLAGDDELGCVAGGPGGGTVSVAGPGELGASGDERVRDHLDREDTVGECGKAVVESGGVEPHGVAGGEVNAASAMQVTHQRSPGSRWPPRAGT